MATFKDNQGREWTIAIDAPAIMRVRATCDPKFLLEDSKKEHTFGRLQSDPVLLCQVLYVLCERQRQSANVSEESFYMDVIGDAIESATDAMLQAILSFSPPRMRKLLSAFAEKTDAIQTLVANKALEKISNPQLEQRLVQQFEAEFDRALTMPGSATSTPGS